MIRISNIKISVKKNIDLNVLKENVAKILHINKKNICKIKIAKQSVDARKKDNVVYIFAVDVEVSGVDEKNFLKIKNVSLEKKFEYLIEKQKFDKRPIIVGFGPAGFMAGLVLAKAGAMPIIIEQGKCVEERTKDVEAFRQNGKINPKSNVQFGEGGAGTFSDGKLTTGIKDPRCGFVLNEFVKAGAPKEILYLAKPHIGTDNLVNMVKNIRNEIISLGGEVHFNTQMINFEEKNGVLKKVIVKNEKGVSEFETNNLILAIGHSSRDTFKMLFEKNINIEQKAFSIGVRIEHSQDFINKSQYGDFAKYLPPADYKLFTHLENGRGVYTFCMCPGGLVVGATSEERKIVTNGMSYYKRDGKNANSAVLVGVGSNDFKSSHPLAGVEYQRQIEEKAFFAGGENYFAPVQTVGDFLSGVPTEISKNKFKDVLPTYLPGIVGSDFSKIFSKEIYFSLQEGIKAFDKKIKGFANKNAIMTAPETRSSSPVRIVRNENFMSNVEGILPCGEGCGYAGGIVSAAVDGVRCAEAVINKN